MPATESTDVGDSGWQKQIPWEAGCDELDNRRESSVDNDERERERERKDKR